MKYLVPLLAGLAVALAGAGLALTLILPHTGPSITGPIGPRGSTGQQGPQGVPGPTVTKTQTKTVHVPVPGPTVTEQAPVPAPSTPTAQAAPDPHAGEVYCTYVRMGTATCTNGGYITGLDGPYKNGSLSYYDGWYPTSQETYG